MEKASVEKPSERTFEPVMLDFQLASGKRAGEQDALYFDLDTHALRAGDYRIRLQQCDGSTTDMPLRILPPPPHLDSPAARVHLGDGEQSITLHGSGLDRIVSIAAGSADLDLKPGSETERRAIVRLRPTAKAGERLALAAVVRDMELPLKVPEAIEVLPPRPRVKVIQTSVPQDLGVSLKAGELPAGSYVVFQLAVDRPEDEEAVVHFQCGNRSESLSERVEHAGKDKCFLAFDPGSAGSGGCRLMGVAEVASIGKSDPFELGRVVRLPMLETIATIPSDPGEPPKFAALHGRNLEVIEKVGWDAQAPVPVDGLPVPIAGEGSREVLKIPLPATPPPGPLLIWLWTEQEPRSTRLVLPQ